MATLNKLVRDFFWTGRFHFLTARQSLFKTEQSTQVFTAPAEDIFAISTLQLVFIDRICTQKCMQHFLWEKHRKALCVFITMERKCTEKFLLFFFFLSPLGMEFLSLCDIVIFHHIKRTVPTHSELLASSEQSYIPSRCLQKLLRNIVMLSVVFLYGYTIYNHAC